MRIVFILAPALCSVVVVAEAQAPCPGPVVSAKAANGKVLRLCLDGKYSTCLRDKQRLGNSYASAKRFCDSRKAGGLVK